MPRRTAALIATSPTGTPAIGLQVVDHDREVHQTIIGAPEARHLGYMLISLASEIESQEAYTTALRSRKEDEMEITDIVGDAAEFLLHRRKMSR